MSQSNIGVFSFRTGAVRLPDLGYALCSLDRFAEDEFPHTAVFEWDAGTWRHGPLSQLQWVADSACIAKFPKEQLVASGPSGRVIVMGQGEMFEEDIYSAGVPPDREGWIREVREIAGLVYAVGMGRQAFRRENAKQWIRIDAGLTPGGEGMEGLESIHGFSGDDIYAVGWGGEIWHFDGRRWRSIASPTNLLLSRVLCAGDDQVYACGQAGVLLRGREDHWEIIEQDDTEEDFWDLEWFEDRLYLSTMKFLYTLEDSHLHLVEFEQEIPNTCYHLSKTHDVLWSFGAKDIMAFDGLDWTRIE